MINVSSLGAYQPVPLNATYGATKAFVSSFTNAVREELRGTDVKLMVVAPGFTRTEFQETSFDPTRHPGVRVAVGRRRGRDRAAGVRPGAHRVHHRRGERRDRRGVECDAGGGHAPVTGFVTRFIYGARL